MKKAKGGEISLSRVWRAIVDFGLGTEWRLESASFTGQIEVSLQIASTALAFVFCCKYSNQFVFFRCFYTYKCMFFQMMPHFYAAILR